MLRLFATWDYEEQTFTLPEDEARLGRDPGNDLVLPVRGVSREHALVRRIPGGVEIRDLGSKNKISVEGQQVARAILTPGLKVQIGAAWLELQELSSSEAQLAVLYETSLEEAAALPAATAALAPQRASRHPSHEEAALTLAYHIARTGIGVPGDRSDLVVRIRSALGAEVLASFERRPSGSLRLMECEGDLQPKHLRQLTAIVKSMRRAVDEEVVLNRAECLLVAGREPWYLAVQFDDHALARETWRKELLRVLAHWFFPPVRSLSDLETAEAARVYRLTGKKTRTAELLGTCRVTLDKLLSRVGIGRKWRRGRTDDLP